MKKSHHLWASQRPFCPDVSTFQTYEPIRISWVGAISLRAGGPLRLANLLLLLFTCVYYTCTYRKGGGRKRPAVCVSGSVVLCGYAICFVVVIHRRSFTFIFESHTLIRLFSTYSTLEHNNNLSACANALWAIVNNASAQPGFNTFPICIIKCQWHFGKLRLICSPVMMRHTYAISWWSFISMSSCWPSSVLMSTLHSENGAGRAAGQVQSLPVADAVPI